MVTCFLLRCTAEHCCWVVSTPASQLEGREFWLWFSSFSSFHPDRYQEYISFCFTTTSFKVHATKMTGSSSDDWIYYHLVTHSHLIPLTYNAIDNLHHLQHTVAHALGFFIFTSRLLATALNTETTKVSHSKYYTKITSSNPTSILRRHYEPSAAVCYRELLQSPTENWPITPPELASVSPINPWSDTREMLQLLRHWWRGHVTLPHSCVIQVFVAVAWQQTRRGDATRCATHHGSSWLGGNTASSIVA
jgi:hypothetical protein